MSPSRGPPPTTSSPSPSTTTETPTEIKADQRSSSALTSAKRNLRYLLDPSNPNAPRPIHLRTRALLRSLRYIGIFIFWRIVRYAKYAVVGSIVAALGATAVGGAISGVGFLLAPPTLATSVGVGIIWAVGKWGFRKVRVGERVGERAGERHRVEEEGVRRDGSLGDVQGPRAVPW